MSKPVILTVDDDPMKRVAPAVGEGAMSVYLVRRYLAAI
jgi:hypothetical protein